MMPPPAPRALTSLAALALFSCPTPTTPATPFPPEALSDPAAWDDPDFIAAWEPAQAATPLSLKSWAGTPPILPFGHRPQLVTARFLGDRIEHISLIYLDAGLAFGYRGHAAQAAGWPANPEERAHAFDAHHAQLKASLEVNLSAWAGGRRGDATRLGQSIPLQLLAKIYENDQLSARLTTADSQLIKLTLFREPRRARSLNAPHLAGLSPRERSDLLARQVRESPNGDVHVAGLPMLPQGERAYCGVATLGMVLQLLGLDVESEELAAASGMRYGHGTPFLRELITAAAAEAGLKANRDTRFDSRKAIRHLEQGFPVLVFRRYSQERDYLHSQFAARFKDDPDAVLPDPGPRDRESWPGRDAPAHSSVITGLNRKRGEVIFTDSWGERVRDRRMTIQELESTSYYAVYFSFAR